jgi:hypothetical protein
MGRGDPGSKLDAGPGHMEVEMIDTPEERSRQALLESALAKVGRRVTALFFAVAVMNYLDRSKCDGRSGEGGNSVLPWHSVWRRQGPAKRLQLCQHPLDGYSPTPHRHFPAATPKSCLRSPHVQPGQRVWP